MSSADVEEIKAYMDGRAALIEADLDRVLQQIVGISHSLDSWMAELRRLMDYEFRATKNLLDCLSRNSEE